MNANDKALAASLRALVDRVRTDATATKTKNGQFWTREPLTGARLVAHISGGPARGVCPIRAGESVTLVALIDLDSHKGEINWADMAATARRLRDELAALGLRVTAFRSSGGHGIHLIILWIAPQDAHSVRRRIWSAIENIGFTDGCKGVQEKEVEVFPKQDAVPADGFGNQFILPLAGESVPLDSNMDPLPRDDALRLEWPTSDPVPYCERPRTVNPSLQTADVKKLRSALLAIPNAGADELGYDDWLKIVMGIHHATQGSAEGLELAREFSARSAKHNDFWLERRTWTYIKDDKDNPVTARSVFDLARKYGWKDAAATEPFSSALVQSCAAFTALDIPPREYLIDGVLTTQSLAMIFGWRGRGKTWLAMSMAVAIASDESWLQWDVLKNQRVLYFDGEMPAADLQNRVRLMVAGRKDVQLDLVSSEFFYQAEGQGFVLNNIQHQAKFLALLEALEAEGRRPGVVFFDNLSSMSAGVDENDNSAMDSLMGFLRELRHLGYTVVVVHHSGKSGDQRGASRREDPLDVVMKLAEPSAPSPNGAAKFKLEFPKYRIDRQPASVECELVSDKDGWPVWAMRETGDAGEKPMWLRILKFIADKRPAAQKEIAAAFARTDSAISRQIHSLQKKKFLENKSLTPTKNALSYLKSAYGGADDDDDF